MRIRAITPATRMAASSRPMARVVAGRTARTLPVAGAARRGSSAGAGGAVVVVVDGGDHDGVAGGEAQLGGRRTPVEGQRVHAVGVEHEPDRARPEVAERRRRRGRPGARRRSSRPTRRRRRSSSSGPTLSWQLPKRSTHSTSAWMPSASSRGSGDHARHQQVRVDRRAELGEVDAVAQVGGDRGEDVAPGERGAGRRRGGTRRWSARRRARRRRRSRRPAPAARCRDRRARRRRRPPRRRWPGAPCRRRGRRRPARRPRARRDGPGQGQRAAADVEGADAVGEVDRP